CARPPGVFDFW
nr:immunoglobulin heavy chain junction region [Mus musculus]MBK4187412.1 immunoglobulin heavy chain junction region [Mus musculus]